jgi:DnaJ homolog subfamily C member 28
VSARLSRGRYDSRVVAKRRDGEGRISVGPTWESIVERQIREAMEDGAFDELPYQGVPIPLDDDSAAGERALGFRVLRNAGVAPPWIEADKQIRELLERRDVLLARAAAAGASPLARARLRRTFERVVAEANRAIERLNAEAPTDRQHRRPLNPDAELARLEAAFG